MKETIFTKIARWISWLFGREQAIPASSKGEVHADPLGLVSGKKIATLEDYANLAYFDPTPEDVGLGARLDLDLRNFPED